MNLREVFAANLRRRRAELGLSQEALAAAAGLDRTYVSSLERCIYGVSIDVMERLAAALGAPIRPTFYADPARADRRATPPATCCSVRGTSGAQPE